MFPAPAQLGVRFAPGTMLGRYELLATIGVGGMASVILARQKGPAGFEKAVVIKLIHPHMAQDTIAVNMLLDEAKVAAQLDHQNIVHTYELGEAHGTYYIVMEYLAGESLGQVLKQGQKQNSPMSPFVAAKIVAEAAEGLHYAHELPDYNGAPMGIVHRDVSPGNIVVQYNGAVKVVDFGIAKAQGRVTSTQDGELKGKYGYMSPEQIKNDVMDRRSDVFSLGVVLWESLARRRLFNADNVAATLMQILQGDRTPPSAYDADIPHALDAVALRALAPDPNDRFQTIAEMKQAIDDAIWKSRVGAAEIQAQMIALFSDRIETRKTMLARATQNALSLGDLEVFGTAFRDPASQPSRPPSMMTPTSGVSQVTAPRTALPDHELASDRSAGHRRPPRADRSTCRRSRRRRTSRRPRSSARRYRTGDRRASACGHRARCGRCPPTRNPAACTSWS
jgi:serine/threonine-protein kinase